MKLAKLAYNNDVLTFFNVMNGFTLNHQMFACQSVRMPLTMITVRSGRPGATVTLLQALSGCTTTASAHVHGVSKMVSSCVILGILW